MQGWCPGVRRDVEAYFATPSKGTLLLSQDRHCFVRSCYPLLARRVAPKETIPCYYNDPLVCWLNG